MNRVLPNFLKNDDKYFCFESSSRYFLLDLNDRKGYVNVGIQEGLDIDILIINMQNVDELHFDVPANSKLHVESLMHFDKNDFKITADVAENGVIDAYFADFITSNCKCDVNANLNGRNAYCDWHLASLCEKQEHKQFDVSVNHRGFDSYSHIDNYGVTRDDAKLVFAGIGHIFNGYHGSKAHQNAKIMVFDRDSIGVAKPLLLIDENDVEASHAAVVGKINDEHIFYLTSRGLSEEEAKQLITFGYLKPIIKGFEEVELQEEITNLIEGKM